VDFGELGGGAFGVAYEATDRRKVGVLKHMFRHGAARLLKPEHRSVAARLQQAQPPDVEIRNADQRITGGEADGLLEKRDHIIQITGPALANTKSEHEGGIAIIRAA
jgi:hypothetical protein